MKKILLFTVNIAVILVLISCAATSTMIKKHNLDVQTKASDSIFLNPVPSSQKVVYMQFKNTSDKPSFNVGSEIVEMLQKKGYTVTKDFDKAHYLLQATILQVGKVSPSANEQALAGGYGASVGKTEDQDDYTDSFSNISSGTIAHSLINGASMIVNSAVKDVIYSAITDLQISERETTITEEKTQSKLQHSDGTQTVQISRRESHWHPYRTRIMSSAEKANLKFETALPQLKKGLATAIVGFF